MYNSNTFAIECYKTVSQINIKLAGKAPLYEVKPLAYYENLYNILVKNGATNEDLENNLVSLATGEFN